MLAPALAFGTRARSPESTRRKPAMSARAAAIRRGSSGNHTTGERSISARSRLCRSCATTGTAPNEPWLRCRRAGSRDHASTAGRPSASRRGRGAVVVWVSLTGLRICVCRGGRRESRGIGQRWMPRMPAPNTYEESES